MLRGNAASLVDPLKGEGIGNAMWSAKLAAESINKALKANDFSESALKDYAAALSKGMRKEMRATYFFQKILKYRSVVNFVVRKASRKRAMIENLWSLLGSETRFPGFHLKVLRIMLF